MAASIARYRTVSVTSANNADRLLDPVDRCAAFTVSRLTGPRSCLIWLLPLAFAASLACAQGSPPMITDDPGTPARGEWEINIGVSTSHLSGVHESEAPLLDINYGLRDNVQLKYEIPWVVLEQEGTRSGLGNSLVGVKWRFVDQGEPGWQISVYPQVEFHNPGSRSAERELVEPGHALLLPFQLLRTFGSFGLNIEVGREWQSKETDTWFAGAVVGRELSDSLEAMVELRANAAEDLAASALALNLSLRWQAHDCCALLASIGRDLRNDLDGESATFGYLGIQFLTGGE